MMIEAANPHDLQAIHQLYEELYACMAALQPDNFRPAQQDESFLRGIMENPEGEILAARSSTGDVLGFAVVQCQNTPVYPSFIPRRYTRLLDIVVTESCRGQGLGKALLQEVERWARSKDSDFIELGVLSENLPAIGVYEKYGYRERRKVMELNLKP